MAIYNKKDSVNMCKISFTRVCTCKHWKNKKCRFLHLIYGIRVSYFPSGINMYLCSTFLRLNQ